MLLWDLFISPKLSWCLDVLNVFYKCHTCIMGAFFALRLSLTLQRV